jgi:hypothetical protein
MSRRAALAESMGAAVGLEPRVFWRGVLCGRHGRGQTQNAPFVCLAGRGVAVQVVGSGACRRELLGVGSVPHGLLIALEFAVGSWLRRGRP